MINKAPIIKGIDIINMVNDDICFVVNFNADKTRGINNVDASDEIYSVIGSRMTVINLTGCRMFEDEIINTLCNDPKIDDIIIIRNDECAGVEEKLSKAGISYRIMSVDEVSQMYRSADENRYAITVNIMPLSLHGDPKYLRDYVYGSVKQISEFSDGIFLFYGLCGNVLKRIEKDLEQLPCPVSILKDCDGKIVDDCIGAVIGGRKSFLKMVSSFDRKSTIVMTPMWVRNWQEMFQHSGFIENKEDIEMAKFVLDSMGYEAVVKIDTGLQYTDDYHEKVEEFADIFQLNILEVEGKLDLISDSYADFRNMVIGEQAVPKISVVSSKDAFTEIKIGNESESPMIRTV